MDVRRFAALALTLPVLALGACTDEGSSKEPSPTPSSESPSPTVTSTGPSTGPSIPPEAQGDDEASAKAFVRYYFAVISEAMTTGDTATLKALQRPRCKSCTTIVKLIDDVYASGGKYRTEGWSVDRATSGSRMRGGRMLLLSVREHPRTLVGKDGEVIDKNPVQVTPMRAILARNGDAGWLIARLDVIR